MTPPTESPKLDGLVVLLRYMDAEQFSHFARQLEKMMIEGDGYGKITLEFVSGHYRWVIPQPHIEAPKPKDL